MIDLFVSKRRTAALTAASAFCLASAAFAAPLKSPPDSFAPLPAPTVQALLGQVQANPQVRSRYAHYFHVPGAHLLAYLRANLVASRLTDDGRYTMFCVRPNGLVYPAVLRMSKGSRVFALRGGPAVLSCPEGNPLARFQTAVETHVVLTPPVAETAPPSPIVTPTQPREIIVPTAVPTPVYQAVSPLTPAEQAADAPAFAPPPTPPKP